MNDLASAAPDLEGFALRRTLGAGTFGDVYEAVDVARNASVALKILRSASPNALYRFKREFRGRADLVHPNLVTLYELFSDGDQWFFTMELVDGVDLVSHARLEDPWRAQHVDRLRSALLQLARGVAALHQAGKLHRDIKPSNILVTPAGRVVLLDFGFVTDLLDWGLTKSTEMVGSPAYMSPEQGAGLALTPASDWYSVGAVLYQMLTGSLPFDGRAGDVIRRKQDRDPPPPDALRSGLPVDLVRLCGDLLARSPEARPAAEEVLQILGSSTPAVSAVRRPAPFVGRAPLLGALRSAFETARQGQAVLALVSGRAGMGKTLLVQRFLEQIEEDEPGALTLAGRCYEQESVPYKALDSLVDALDRSLKALPPAQADAVIPREIRALGRVFPVLAPWAAGAPRRDGAEATSPHELRRRAVAGLRELLARLADRRPLVLFIDDLHWGDADSAALLAELLEPPDPPPLLVIGTYRTEDGPASPMLPILAASRARSEGGAVLRELVVDELDPEAARHLAAALLDETRTAPADLAGAIARESNGNPFFIGELVRYAATRGSDGGGAQPEAPAGVSMEQVIRARIDSLPDAARALLETVSVAGRPVDADVVARVAGLRGDVSGIMALLRAAHLLRSRRTHDRRAVEPYHDRVRETVAMRLSPERRRQMHLGFAVELEAAGSADPEALAYHFREGGETTRAALYTAHAAAQSVEALAFDHAAHLFRIAIDLQPAGSTERFSLSAKLGDALANAGRGAEAAEAYLHAASGASGRPALELRRRAAEQLLFSGRADAGREVLRGVLAALGMPMPATVRRAIATFIIGRVRVRFRGYEYVERKADEVPADDLLRIDTCWSANQGLGWMNPVQGAAFQVRHLLLALQAGEPRRIARAMATEMADASLFQGQRGRRLAKDLFTRTSQLVAQLGDPYLRAQLEVHAGLVAWNEGRWSDAKDLAGRAARTLRTECTGVLWELVNAELCQMNALYYRGELAELRRSLPQLLKRAEDRGDLHAVSFMRLRIGYLAALVADQPAEAQRLVEEVAARSDDAGHFIGFFLAFLARTETDLYVGAAASAWDRIRVTWKAIERSHVLHVPLVLVEGHGVRARSAVALAASGGAEKDLLRTADRGAERIEKANALWGGPMAALIRAGAASVRGRAVDARLHLERAEELLTAAEMDLHADAARHRRGQLAGGSTGDALIETARASLAARGVASPEAMVDMLIPGRWGAMAG